jgi:hypothetical protein
VEKTKRPDNHPFDAETETNDMKLRVIVDDYAVTLNFPSEPQSPAIMTEVKRMMLSGQANAQN